MTIELTEECYSLVYAAAGGLLGIGFLIWTAIRYVHPLSLLGGALVLVGITGVSFSGYCQRPSPTFLVRNDKVMASVEKDMIALYAKNYESQMAEWEALGCRHWLRPAWPAFLVVVLLGLACMLQVFVQWMSQPTPIPKPGERTPGGS